MEYLARFTVVVLLVCGASLFAQNNSPSAGQKQAPSASTSDAQAPTKPAMGEVVEGLEVLSDTTGVNIHPYLERVMQIIKRNWYYHIPDSAKAPIRRKGEVVIEFAILKDGSVKGMKLVRSSGDVALDRGGWAGIVASNPLAPLPTEFGGEYLALRMKFLYNSGPVRPADVIVSPASVQLASGSKQQFSASVPGAANPAVNWSLACSAAVCGSISAEGLYTAPVSLQNPTTVTAIATLAADPIETGSAMVSIQPAPPR
jgi:TonB family protein